MSVQATLVFAALVLLTSQSAAVLYSGVAVEEESLESNPVVLLGGLFPVHKNEDNRCGDILDLGVQRLEAMVFASRRINESPDLLPNVSISFEIRDTCVHPNRALEESLRYVRGRGRDNTTSAYFGVSGVVGAASSGVSIVVANLLRLFSTPQISYASTAKILSDKTRFDYFFRTVPPDSLQARAMAAIIKEFGWTYVHAIHSDDAYGSEGIQAFFDEISARAGNSSKICVASTIKIPHGVTSASLFDDAVERLDHEWVRNSTVVVLFGQLSTATGILTAVEKRNSVQPGFAARFTWIGSDAWGDQLPSEYHSVAKGLISVSPKGIASRDFDEYFTSLKPSTNVANPWFREYWESFFNCTFGDHEGLQLCDPASQVISPESGYRQNSKVTFTIDAVYAFAHAIHNVIYKNCPNNDLCPEIIDKSSGGAAIKGELLLTQLRNISFPGASGATIQFDSSGDEQGDFIIRNLKKSADNSRFFYDAIGTWSPLTGLSLVKDIEWNSGHNNTPLSTCSLPGGGGEFPEQIPNQEDCCWQCQNCLGVTFVSQGVECYECEEGFKPNEERTGCINIIPGFLQWYSPWSLIAIVLSLCGMAATVFISVLLGLARKHPMVKASSRELSAMMLCGIFFCYCLPFLLIAQPSLPICAIRRLLIGIAFSLCYSPLLVKANRIYRIFQKSNQSNKKTALISPKSQLFFVFLLVSVQVIISVVWLTLERPGVLIDYKDFDAELSCNEQPILAFFIYFTYNFILLIVSCIFGLRSKKIPKDFNESKLIKITLVATLLSWLGIAPTYFGTGAIVGRTYQTIALILGIILSVTTMFVVLFMPKIYLLLSQRCKQIQDYNEEVREHNERLDKEAPENDPDRLLLKRMKKKRQFSLEVLGKCIVKMGVSKPCIKCCVCVYRREEGRSQCHTGKSRHLTHGYKSQSQSHRLQPQPDLLQLPQCRPCTWRFADTKDSNQ